MVSGNVIELEQPKGFATFCVRSKIVPVTAPLRFYSFYSNSSPIAVPACKSEERMKGSPQAHFLRGHVCLAPKRSPTAITKILQRSNFRAKKRERKPVLLYFTACCRATSNFQFSRCAPFPSFEILRTRRLFQMSPRKQVSFLPRLSSKHQPFLVCHPQDVSMLL